MHQEFTKIRYSPCSLCRNKKGPLSQPGFYYTSYGTIVECNCHKEWVSKNLLMLKTIKAEIDLPFLDRDLFSEYDGKKSIDQVLALFYFAERFSNDERFRSQSLYIVGPHSTQKSTVSKFIGCYFLKAGFGVHYLKMKKLIEFITPSFKADQAKIEADLQNKEYLLNIDVLILDNSFQLKVAEFQKEYLEDFIKERIEDRKKTTIFVSTVFPKNISSEGFSESLQTFILREIVDKGALFLLEDVHGQNYDLKKELFGEN